MRSGDIASSYAGLTKRLLRRTVPQLPLAQPLSSTSCHSLISPSSPFSLLTFVTPSGSSKRMSFLYQTASWKQAQRVMARVEFHHGELFPRVGFILTNLALDNRAVVRFYNNRGMAEQCEDRRTIDQARTLLLVAAAESHLTRRLFAGMLAKIAMLPSPAR
jgi:hypothetical protein